MSAPASGSASARSAPHCRRTLFALTLALARSCCQAGKCPWLSHAFCLARPLFGGHLRSLLSYHSIWTSCRPRCVFGVLVSQVRALRHSRSTALARVDQADDLLSEFFGRRRLQTARFLFSRVCSMQSRRRIQSAVCTWNSRLRSLLTGQTCIFTCTCKLSISSASPQLALTPSPSRRRNRWLS